MKKQILIGLPAYNEEKNISELLNKICLLKKELTYKLCTVIVNDGSEDNTEEILFDYSRNFKFISYINHSKNLGLSKAIQTLIKFTTDAYSDQDILIIFDADNTHNPNIIPKMISKLEDNNLDIVIASRFTDGGTEIGLNFIRKIYSRGAKFFCNVVFNIDNVTDYSCGYRAYRIGFLKEMYKIYGNNLINSNGFECMIELLVKCGKSGARIGEYPLKLEYHLKKGSSKMKVIKTILGYFKLAFNI